MPTQPAPTYQHHTVPIGGAPFVHPSIEAGSIGSSTSCYSSFQPTSPQSASSSPTASSSSSSTWSDSDSSSPHMSPIMSKRQAALAYSRGLHQHTTTMWELERRQIEKERLDQQYGSPTQSRSPRNSSSSGSSGGGGSANATSASATAEHQRSSTWDLLLGRSRSRKSTAKNAGRGHTRQSASIS